MAHIPDAAHDLVTRDEVLTTTGLPGIKRTRWAWIIATFFGAGLMKPGPGTYGSIAATLVWYIVATSLATHGHLHLLPLVTLGMAALATAVGIPAATRVARESGRKDPQIVVIDEVAGQWLTLTLCLPYVDAATHHASFMPFAVLGLVCFRLFDILKPPPIRRLEKYPAGTGIVVDDLGAGVYALILQAILQQGFITWQIMHHAAKAH